MTRTTPPRIPGTRAIDINGQRFGRLTVLSHAGGGVWDCLCDCGRRVTKSGGAMRGGHVRSCGCLGAEAKAQWVQTRRLQFIKQLRAEGWTITPPSRAVPMDDAEALGAGGIY